MKDKNKAKVKPSHEIDLKKVSVYDLMKMLERGESLKRLSDASCIMMFLMSAQMRGVDAYYSKKG